MTLCSPCTKLNPIYFCNGTSEEEPNIINIGSVVGNIGSSRVYFQSRATDAIYSFELQSRYQPENVPYTDFWIEFYGNFPLAVGIDYEMWIATDEEPNTKLDIYIPQGGAGVLPDMTPNTCYIFSGTKVYDLGESEFQTFLEQDLSIFE